MARNADYIPRRSAEFDPWYIRLVDYVVMKTSGETPQWTHIPPEEVSALNLSCQRWHEAFLAAAASPGPAQIAAKRTERAASEAFIRPFVNRYLRYPPVTDADRAAMGIPNRKASRSPIPAPLEAPQWTMNNDGLFKIRVDIKPSGAERPFVPKGYDGAILWYAVTDHPVRDAHLLDQRGMFHQGISNLQFTQDEDGKYLSAALEWLTHRGLFGPLSDVRSIKIR